jgi:phenylpyruvate tautomerase PptA (4-oxalocrotonate tautomerase family)
MPFVRVSLSQAFSDTQVAGISTAIHDALVGAFNVPAADRFQVLTRHPPGELVYSPEYLGIPHGDQIVLIHITANEGRTVEMKKTLFAAIASSVAEAGAMSAADVIITLVEVKKENWSFGNGVAQYAV